MAGKAYRVGLVSTTPVAKIVSDPSHPFNSGFRREMRDLDYAVGHGFLLELRSVDGRIERTPNAVAVRELQRT